MHTHAHAHTHARTHTRTHTHKHTHMHVHTHAHTHTCKHTQTYLHLFHCIGYRLHCSRELGLWNENETHVTRWHAKANRANGTGQDNIGEERAREREGMDKEQEEGTTAGRERMERGRKEGEGEEGGRGENGEGGRWGGRRERRDKEGIDAQLEVACAWRPPQEMHVEFERQLQPSWPSRG